MSPAHGCGGARAIIEFNNSPSAKKSGEARKQAGKKEGGLGEGIFARLRFPRRRRGWGGSVPPSGGRKRWAGINPQNPLDFAQSGFGFRPANTTKFYHSDFNFFWLLRLNI